MRMALEKLFCAWFILITGHILLRSRRYESGDAVESAQ
jgi:hypothetical protein